MNTITTIKSLLVIICLLLSFNLQAQDVPPVTINVAKAGTLPSLIASTEKYQITNLILTGDLNGTDMLYIREMAGGDINGNSTTGKLSVLDLSGANIVPGGSSYYIAYNGATGANTSLNEIGSYAFYSCATLTSVIIPNSVTSIRSNAFYYCTRLTSVAIPNSVTSIGSNAFYGCTGLTSITIGSGVTSIGSYAFSSCRGLTSINIPNSVISIGSYAFYYCTGLTSIAIGSGVTSIESYAFSSCIGIKEIHSKALIPIIITNLTFSGINKTTCKLYIPKGTYTAYRLAVGWGNFTNIIEKESTAISQIEANNLKVYTDQNAIIIKDAELGDNISVYTESGALLQTTKVTDSIIRISAPVNHTYLVKTTEKVFKVAL